MLFHYIKSFFSSVAKNRFFYSINLFGFVTGFLLLTVILTYVYQELSFDKFHTQANNICRIHSGGYGVTPMCFAEKLKNQVPEIDQMIRLNSTDLTLVNNHEKFKLDKCYYSDAEVFQVFSFNLLSGDAATVLKNPFSIVIDKSLAEEMFGNQSPIGQTVRDNSGNVYTITGVMDQIPYNSHIRAQAFISIETLRQTGDETTFNCGSWCILTYISLLKSADIKAVENKINTILEDSQMGSGDGKIPLLLQPLKAIYFDYTGNKYDGCPHGNKQTVAMYFAISVLILLIVIINYINLSAAISTSRIKEFAIRKVNGAERVQVIRHLMMESLGVVFLSFALAITIIEWLLPWLSRLLNLPISDQLNRSGLYLVYFIGIMVIGIITGLAPGVFLAKVNEAKALKNELMLKSRGIRHKVLLGIQLVIVAVLLNSVFIVEKQISYVLSKDLAFKYKNIVYFHTDPVLANKKEIVKKNLLQNPAIEMVSFSGGLMGDGFSKKPVLLKGNENLCYFYSIDPDYLQLYQIKLKQGRNFLWDLKTDLDNSCLVNVAFCKKFGIENPLNMVISGRTIIGVVNDFNFVSLHSPIEPLVLACENPVNVVQVKIATNTSGDIIDRINEQCREISPDYEGDSQFLEARLKQLYQSELNMKQSFQIYTLVAFLIALLGLLGLTMFVIRKKTKEAAIRKLYGAKLSDTFKLFAKGQVVIVAISNLVALPLSYWIMSRWLSNFQYRITIGAGIFLATFFITLILILLAISWLILKTHQSKLIETLNYE
jgi:putative ABC transport system permease protein